MAVVHAAALNEVHHAAGRIWQREGGFDELAAVALAGPQHRCIITAKSSEKCPIWPPAPAARLTPHSAVTPCGELELELIQYQMTQKPMLRCEGEGAPV